MALLSYIDYNIWVISFHIKNPIRAPIKTQMVQYKFYKLFFIFKANHKSYSIATTKKNHGSAVKVMKRDLSPSCWGALEARGWPGNAHSQRGWLQSESLMQLGQE